MTTRAFSQLAKNVSGGVLTADGLGGGVCYGLGNWYFVSF